jgi:hypothetical protein
VNERLIVYGYLSLDNIQGGPLFIKSSTNYLKTDLRETVK